MIEDELLKFRLKRGRPDAMRHIYEKCLNYMLSLAMAFLNDAHAAESGESAVVEPNPSRRERSAGTCRSDGAADAAEE